MFLLIPTDKPTAPRNLHAVETDRDYIVLAWDPPESDGGSPITEYILEKRDIKRPGYVFVADMPPSENMKFKVTRLFEGYEYMFRVVAENQVGPSEPCETEKPIKAKPPYGE